MHALFTRAVAVVLLAGFAAPATQAPAEAQLIKRLKRTAQDAAESELASQLDRMVRGKVRCVFDDLDCISKGEKSGKGVVLTDDSGAILVDDSGRPVSDPKKAAEVMAQDPAPGEGVWANYDFVPGSKVLFHEDFAADNVGDFPRRLELVRGNFEVVESGGRRLLRSTGGERAAIRILLAEDLPERFTIELEVQSMGEGQILVVSTVAPPKGRDKNSLANHFLTVSRFFGTGVGHADRNQELAITKAARFKESLIPIRLMADGRYMKVFVDEQRVANVPNAEMPRGSELYVELYTAVTDSKPYYFGTIRVAAGGRDLYNRLAADGRVATHGILFGVNSARIRPESTPTLAEIGKMLTDHPQLRIRIEGHTDATGEDAFNQKLSEERARSVLEYISTKFGIDQTRLEAAGFGETKPVDSNDSSEGRQNNRRVELVRLDA